MLASFIRAHLVHVALAQERGKSLGHSLFQAPSLEVFRCKRLTDGVLVVLSWSGYA
jgi:hypothetical protein